MVPIRVVKVKVKAKIRFRGRVKVRVRIRVTCAAPTHDPALPCVLPTVIAFAG